MEMAQPGPSNRVRVEDALSYLDQVKTMFMDHPAIYTHFLDIMKDFKSQAIDTPGVIGRVTQLFRGHPALIVGFNTFLPAGFEVRIDADGRISILEPNGNIITVENEPLLEENENVEDEDDYEYECDGGDGGEDIEEIYGEPMEDIVEEEDEREDTPQVINLLPPPSPKIAIPPSKNTEIVQNISASKSLKKKVVCGRSSRLEKRLGEDMRLMIEEEVIAKKPRQKNMKEKEGSTHNAVDYVNKIKIRFASSPIVYKEFLKILTVYQKRQNYASSSGRDCLKTERMVMGAIAQLFKYHTDLIHQFQFFLPNAAMVYESRVGKEKDSKTNRKEEDQIMKEVRRVGKANIVTRRPVQIQDAIKIMNRDDIVLFDKIRQITTDREFKIIMNHMDVYSNGISSRKDFMIGVSTILSKFPNIYNSLISYLCNSTRIDKDVEQTRASLDIDYSSCKLNGLSYRALPENISRPKCSGRTPLCNEVLNETWISIPSWASEDSSVVSAKKTQFEEFVYRTEDERFEFDIVMETNRYAIGCLQEMQFKLSKLSNSELMKLDMKENWGVSSPAIFLRAIRRVYGEMAGRMLDSLRKDPKLAVDTLLDSLKEKEREWTDNLHEFNKGWREQVEKHTIRSLDQQSTVIKQSDSKFLRPKNLINQIENIFEESKSRGAIFDGPHMNLTYDEDRRAIVDATDLLIHHVRRSNLSKEEKKRVKNILRKFVCEIMGVGEGASSDVEEGTSTISDCRLDGGKKINKEKMLSSNSCTYRLIYSGNVFYVFLRIHNVLCERLAKLRRACDQLWKEQKLNDHLRGNSSSWNDLQKGLNKVRGNGYHAPSFDHVMFLLKESLDGNIEPVNLEDEMRKMLPTHASLAFSIDKMVTTIVRQLHIFSSPDSDKAHTLRLYNKFKPEKPCYMWDRTPTKCVHEDAYGEEAKRVMDGHNCFRIYAIDRENLLITIELMEKDGDGGGKHSSLSKGRISKKDKIMEKKDGWRVKKSINKSSISSLSTNDISPSLPHGKQISILPFNYPDGDVYKECGDNKDGSVTDGETSHRSMFYGRLKQTHNHSKTIEKRNERKGRCNSWFM